MVPENSPEPINVMMPLAIEYPFSKNQHHGMIADLLSTQKFL